MAKKKLRFREQIYLNSYGFTLEDVKNVIEEYSEKLLIPQENLSIEVDYIHSYYDSIEIEMAINGERLETDEEETERLAKQKETNRKAREKRKEEKIQKEKKDFEEYERLKKKFEK